MLLKTIIIIYMFISPLLQTIRFNKNDLFFANFNHLKKCGNTVKNNYCYNTFISQTIHFNKK